MESHVNSERKDQIHALLKGIETGDATAVAVVNRDTDNMVFFDIATRTATHTVALEDFPVHVAITPDGQYAVAPNVFSNSVSVVDIATHTVAAHVPISGVEPYRVAITSDSKYAVVGVINDAVNSSFSIVSPLALMAISAFEWGLWKMLFENAFLSLMGGPDCPVR